MAGSVYYFYQVRLKSRPVFVRDVILEIARRTSTFRFDTNMKRSSAGALGAAFDRLPLTSTCIPCFCLI